MKMKIKIVKIIVTLILLAIVAVLFTYTYYIIAEIETKAPENEEICNIETEQFMGRKIFIVTPKNTPKSEKTILYFHGGSYVAEATSNHWEFIENIVNDKGVTLIMPDYPLTPKYTYKDVFEMVEPLYKEIIKQVDKTNLVVMGDSAGGGISLALVEKMAEEEVELPEQTILISPWLDVRLNNPKIDEVQKIDNELNRETLRIAGINYASDDGINSYLVNPIEGDLSKLKNVTIFTGTKDILNPDCHLLQEKAIEQGSKITLNEYENAGHIWMIEKNSSEELVEKGYQDIINLL